MAYDILTDGPPAHFEYYLPDDVTSQCLIIMTPSKVKGAINFSEANPPIIGIYRSYVPGQRFRFKNIPALLDISVESVNKLIVETKPAAPQARKIYNFTAGKVEMVPATINSEVNYSDAHLERKLVEANVSGKETLKAGDIPKFEHDQKFDQLGRAIKKIYDENGLEIVKSYGYISDKNATQARMYNQPIVDFLGNVVVLVYDAYGDVVNGVTGDDNGITIPATAIDRNGKKVTMVFDTFGNQVVGLSTQKGLIVYPQLLPIKLDSSGRPIKKSVGFNFAMIGL